MPPLIKTKVGNIEMWVRQGPQAAWDVGTSHCIIAGDEYALRHFSDASVRHKVHTVVDVGVSVDAESALVVEPVVSRAEADEVPGVGGSVVFPVDDVVDLEVVGGVTAGDAAAVVAAFDFGAQAR